MNNKKKIQKYIELLKKHNEKINIYSKKAYDKLDFHINDSINIAKIITNKPIKVIDLGSGAGFPAIIIAIINIKNQIIAIESKEKKRKLLHLVKDTLEIENMEIFKGDIQTFIKERNDQAQFYTAKAFAKPEKVITIVTHMTHKKSTLIIPISKHQINDIKNKKENEIIKKEKYYYFVKDIEKI